MVEDFTSESEVFTLSLGHEGYIQEDVTVNSVNNECENCENTFSINLEKIDITDPVDPAITTQSSFRCVIELLVV
jgi:hypothetical protein